MVNYTAKYTKIPSGYMGQVVEWPEVVTEGRDVEECRAMLRDALKEMMLAYEELCMEIPNRSNNRQRDLQAGRYRAQIQISGV